MSDPYIEDPTDEKFIFRAKIHIKKCWISDVDSKGHESKYESQLCFLEPEVNDETIKFFKAWLPDLVYEGGDLDENNRRELAMELGSPINGIARGAVMRGNSRFPLNHIFIMSVGIEDEILKRKLNNKMINIKTLPSSSENEADFTRETQRMSGETT